MIVTTIAQAQNEINRKLPEPVAPRAPCHLYILGTRSRGPPRTPKRQNQGTRAVK
ncbi:hypothetical protein SL1157_1578 [Ruegeria lacuscaerulensis ITI-1157]|nr:hypothetical protein SL1157_1578 [Ruegeria lacuscaerulensis ITI-1157]